MIRVLGVELGPEVLRAVAFGWISAPRGWEIPWDPERPEEGVERLRAQVGPVRRIALSVGLGFLHPKRVTLPPAPAGERRRMLALEPDRFFPVQGRPVAVSLAGEGSVAFAADADLIERWTRAFEEWAPVEAVVAAPHALARALTKSDGTLTVEVPARAGETGVVTIAGGEVRAARRIPAGEPLPELRALPSPNGIAGELLAAYGTALLVDAPVDAMLLSAPMADRVRARRGSRRAAAAVFCVVALALALWSVDRARERWLERIEGQIAALEPRAAHAAELRDRIAGLDREASAIAELGRGRPDPLGVLAALGERLPRDATVLNARASGADWQIDGTAAEAAAIVPLLDRDARFQDVRFLSASQRFSDAGRTYETFSIAFHAPAQP